MIPKSNVVNSDSMRVIEAKYEAVLREKINIAGAKLQKRNRCIFDMCSAPHTEPQLAHPGWVRSGRAMKNISLCVVSAVSAVQRLGEREAEEGG